MICNFASPATLSAITGITNMYIFLPSTIHSQAIDKLAQILVNIT